MLAVFISHSSADRQAVEKSIVTLLTSHGIRVWYCKEDIATGAEWEKAIREGLESCDWFLVVVSPRAIDSEWVRCEVDWGIENRRGHFVPVLMEPCDPSRLHLKLRMMQFIDFSDASTFKERLLEVWGLPYQQDGRQETEDRSALRSSDGFLYTRPKNWFCIFCGWKCDESFNDYICKLCGHLRPFTGGSATVRQCLTCEGFSLALATYCEWCGATFV